MPNDSIASAVGALKPPIVVTLPSRAILRTALDAICDNALWSGNVLQSASKQDADTRGVVRYNKDAFGAADLLTTIVPLRDGVALSLKVAPDKRRR